MTIKKSWLVYGLVLLMIVVLTTAVYAEILAPNYTIGKSAIAAGGHQTITAGNYSLSGTVGQTAVGAGLNSGNYNLNSGFWTKGSSTSANHHVYLPMIIK